MSIDTPEQLRQWLAGLNQEHLTERFLAGGWRGDHLLTLTPEDLADLAVPKPQRGEILLAIEALRQGEGPVTLPDEHAPSYTPQFTPAVMAQCQALGRHPPKPWVTAVADTWPGPIAHEYHRLQHLLVEGHLVPAIFQLKDLVEVLIKFPALVLARDLLQHGDADTGRAVRQALFGSPLSLGAWLAQVRDVFAPQALRQATGEGGFPELGALFVTCNAKGKVTPTPWCQTLARLVSWRNDELGHGAFRLDPAEYLSELSTHLSAINETLAAHQAQGVWARAHA